MIERAVSSFFLGLSIDYEYSLPEMQEFNTARSIFSGLAEHVTPQNILGPNITFQRFLMKCMTFHFD